MSLTASVRRARPALLPGLAAGAVLAVVLGVTGCDAFEPKDPGERLFRRYCSECHGVDGRGNTPLYMGNDWADLTDNSWRGYGDDATLETIIREGVFGQMPGRSELTRDEMRALLNYLRKLRGETTR